MWTNTPRARMGDLSPYFFRFGAKDFYAAVGIYAQDHQCNQITIHLHPSIFILICTNDIAEHPQQVPFSLVTQWTSSGASILVGSFSSGEKRLLRSYFACSSDHNSAFDTTCSSSFVALHAAVLSLEQGECKIALVVAVNQSKLSFSKRTQTNR